MAAADWSCLHVSHSQGLFRSPERMLNEKEKKNFFLDPLKVRKARPPQKYVPTEMRARTLVRPGTQTERKALLRAFQ